MKLARLSHAISSLYYRKPTLITYGADISPIYAPIDPPVVTEKYTHTEYMVKSISIAGQYIELIPRLILKEGTVIRIIKTSGHTHTFEVSTDVTTGGVSSKLTSVLDSTGEEVSLMGEWSITRYDTHYNSPKRIEHSGELPSHLRQR